jgi:hypothetical protein
VILVNAQPAQAPIVATVTAIGSGRYTLQDDAGRTLRAESNATWRIGDRVVLLAGRILGPAGNRRPTRTYEV